MGIADCGMRVAEWTEDWGRMTEGGTGRQDENQFRVQLNANSRWDVMMNVAGAVERVAGRCVRAKKEEGAWRPPRKC